MQVHYWVFRNLGDIENPLTSLGVKYRPLKIRATANVRVRIWNKLSVSFEYACTFLRRVCSRFCSLLNVITISLYTSLFYTNYFCCLRRLCHHYSIQGTKHYHSQLIIARIMFQPHPQPGLTLQSTSLHKPQKLHTCTNITLTRWVSWWSCSCCFSFYKRTGVC